MILAHPLEVREPGETARARRAAAAAARELGFDEHDCARAALVATEVATNLIRHAGGGELLLASRTDGGGGPVLQLFSLDRGPGFVEQVARRDGFSTAGGAGTGLGAITRACDRFDLYTHPGGGAVLFCEIAPRPPSATAHPRFRAGGFSVAMPGEEVCGDAWAACANPDGLAIILLDGLGHGTGAAEAAGVGMQGFLEEPDMDPVAQLGRLHDRLRPTRGAAVAVVRLDWRRDEVCYASVGNTQAILDDGERPRHLLSNNGTLGHEVLRVRETVYAWPRNGVLVLATDGLTTRLALSEYPGLRRHLPEVIAAVLYRDFRRGRDDATVLVVMEEA